MSDPESDEKTIQELALAVTQRNLVTPAILLLELAKPLSFFVSQLLIVADPLLSPLMGGLGYRYHWLLEDRRRIERLLAALEREKPHHASKKEEGG